MQSREVKNQSDKEKVVNYVKKQIAYYSSLEDETLISLKDKKRSKSDEFAYNVAIYKMQHRSSLETKLRKHPEVKNFHEFIDGTKRSVFFEVHGREVFPIVHHSTVLSTPGQQEVFYNEVYNIFTRNLPHYLKPSQDQPVS